MDDLDGRPPTTSREAYRVDLMRTLRLAYIRAAEEYSQMTVGRVLTGAEFAGVLALYEGDTWPLESGVLDLLQP
jgi:enterochelin esterase-like enzyme